MAGLRGDSTGLRNLRCVLWLWQWCFLYFAIQWDLYCHCLVKAPEWISIERR